MEGTLSGFSEKDHITSRAVNASVTIFTLTDPIWKALALAIAIPWTGACKRMKEMLYRIAKIEVNETKIPIHWFQTGILKPL